MRTPPWISIKRSCPHPENKKDFSYEQLNPLPHAIMNTQKIAVSISLLAFLQPLTADTFTLKDGTVLEGKILRQDATSYFLEVNVTKSIKDERIVPKADVKSVVAVKPDLVAFEEIAKLVPAPDLLTGQDYGVRIRAVETFLKEHRGSSKTKQAKEILDKLKSEANEVLAGGIKMSGRIVPPADYRSNQYDIDSRILESRIKAQAKAGQTLLALRSHSEMQRDFRNTNAFSELIPFMEKVINLHTTQVSQMLSTFDARVKERETGLNRMSQADRRVTEAAIKEESAGFEARFKVEKDSQIGWVTPRPYFKPSLEETLSFAKQELGRLAAAKNAAPIDGGKIYRETLSLILSKGEGTAVTNALSSARSAGMSAPYLARLEEAARASGAIK
jgi:hypothetical protein